MPAWHAAGRAGQQARQALGGNAAVESGKALGGAAQRLPADAAELLSRT